MRTLLLAVCIGLSLVSPAVAHNGAISLYEDPTLTDCDRWLPVFEMDTVRVFYVRGNGPELGRVVEFKLDLTSANAQFNRPPVWSSAIGLVVGDIESGISLTSSSCMGLGQNVVYLGSIYLLNMGESGTFYLCVAPHPASGAIRAGLCDETNTMVSVSGGSFIYNGYCNVGVQEASWGAIKSLYRAE
jgi:hypothetical protein